MQKLQILNYKDLNINVETELKKHIPDLKINEEIIENQEQKQEYLWDIKPTKLSIFKRRIYKCMLCKRLRNYGCQCELPNFILLDLKKSR